MSGTLTYSIGTRVCNADGEEYCSNILAKGVTLPAYVRKTYYAAVDGQQSIDLELLKNDSTEVRAPLEECSPFNTIMMKLPAGVAANDEIEIIYTIGLNGLLIVTCKCKGSIVEKNIDL